ncbi:unnamed protein product [Schistosoma rodhaini]|uniref:DUF862 domain-containing protein n=1 Tax=Schistosoma mansoni TaxID=6183 RepID=G4V5X9_SCHMA|nr:hypothetical protein Smp_152220 [Schistosoma mansoni]CAH8431095.1 unnamed protein product [Schistosoma rodhaini]|eukprot:XP_018647567.1 hypothetical protein Smp_152220 [Schistosoma mansoni]
MSPLMGFWEKLRMKLDRVSSTQTSTSENHETETNTTIPNCTITHSTNNSVATPVTVNVYDMLWINDYVSSLGIGVYHTGVVVHGTEYSYGGHPLTNSGVFSMLPRDSAYLGENYSYKVTLSMGYTDFTASDVTLLLESITTDYRGDQYHLLNKNCNHFSDTFVQLLCGRSLPKWINRLATIGSKLPFIERTLPIEWLRPHQQINNPINKEEIYDNNIECIEQSQTTSLHNLRRISAIERLQNCLHHHFHKGNIHKHEQNHSDTYSLINIPFNKKPLIDHNWYLYLTQCRTFYESDSDDLYNTTNNPSMIMTNNTFNDDNTHRCIDRQPIQEYNSYQKCTDPSSSYSYPGYSFTNKIPSHSVSLPSTLLNHSRSSCKSFKSIKRSQSITFDNYMNLDNNEHVNMVYE